MAMKKRTMSLYDEWSRLDSVIAKGSKGSVKKAAIARKKRVGELIARERLLEDRNLDKLEKSLKKL